jgi:hypothetical protein
MRCLRAALTLAAAGLAGLPAGADVVRLANGNVLEGIVRDDGEGKTIAVEMRIGTCHVRRARVLSIEKKPYDPPAPVKTTWKPAPPATPPAGGDDGELSLFGEAGSRLPPREAPAPEGGNGASSPDRNGSSKDPEPEPSVAAADVRAWILAAAAPGGAAAAGARKRLADLPGAVHLDHASRALRSHDPALRRAGALSLRASKDPAAIPPLARRAMAETDGAVLRTVARSLGELGDPAGWAGRYFAGRLVSGDRATRARAAEVLGWTGDARWLPVLIRRYMRLWGSTNRGYCLLSNQTAYVPDYDIEVAAGVAIPDPKVGVVQDGVVLDAKVLKVVEEGWWYERGIVHDAMVRLAGADAGRLPEAWVRWWNGRQVEAARRAAEKALQAASRRMADPSAETRAQGHREALETIEKHRLPAQVKAWADAFKAASDRHWTAVVTEVESRRVVLDLRLSQVQLHGFRRLPIGGPVNAVLELPVVTRVGYQGTVVVPAGGRR